MIIIPGFTPAYKVPTIAVMNEFGAGRSSVGTVPVACVCFGNMHSDGDAELNTRYPITGDDEAAARFGGRSELARMLYAALETGGSGVTLYGVAVAEASGGTAATLPIVIGGTWNRGGEITLQIDEEIIRVAVAASHTPTTFGDALEDAINAAQNSRLFCTAANTTGRVVLTVQNLGERGNYHVAFLDISKAPAGFTIDFDQNSDVTQTGGGPAITITGTPTAGAEKDYRIQITTGGNLGASVLRFSDDGGATWVQENIATAAQVSLGTSGLVANMPAGAYVQNTTYNWTSYGAELNGGRYFYGGAGTDDLEDALDATQSVTNDLVAAAQNDAVNVAALEAAINAKAAWDVNRPEQYVVCRNRGLTDAIALGQATMNDALGQCLWPQNHPEHPSRTAARVAALRSITEGVQPNTNYDGRVITGAAPHKRDADSPSEPTQNAALSAGVTPLITVDGKLVIVRAITSRCLNGSAADYRTYDVADVAVPIRVRKELAAIGAAMREKNPYIGPDIPDKAPDDLTFTPGLWLAEVRGWLATWSGPQFNWIHAVAENPPSAEWNAEGEYVLSVVPAVAKPQFHSLGIIVRQTA